MLGNWYVSWNFDPSDRIARPSSEIHVDANIFCGRREVSDDYRQDELTHVLSIHCKESSPLPQHWIASSRALFLIEFRAHPATSNEMEGKNSSPPGNCKFAIPKKGRLHDKCVDMLKGAGIEFRREPRLDIALCVGLPITLVFLPAADIAKFVGKGDVDIGITGFDVVMESQVHVDKVIDLGFGKCKLCVQAPIVDKIESVESLAGKRIATSFVNVTADFFKAYDEKAGTTTEVSFVSGSVEAACGLGLADAVVDLVETGTTMKVSYDPMGNVSAIDLVFVILNIIRSGCGT